MTSPDWTLTRETPKRFIVAFTSLAATKNSGADDLKHEAYFDTLGELPIVWVEEGAKRLREEASSFMPDAGTWFRLSDALAATAWEKATASEANQLTGGQEVERGEEAATRRARSAFLDKLEAVGQQRGFPVNRAVWDAYPVRLPTYACAVCNDLGWIPHPCTQTEAERAGYQFDRYGHCRCWDTNPVLRQKRHESGTFARRRSEAHGGVSGGAVRSRRFSP